MGDLGLPGSVVEVTEPALQKDIWEVRKAGLNIMMSMKGDGKPVSFIEDCAVPRRASRRVHGSIDEGVREARHEGHLVCACLGRHAACAAGAQHEAGGRQADARDRRRGMRDGARVQGRLFRRARRWPGALGMDRADRGKPARARARRDQGSIRPEGFDEPRARSCGPRRWTIGRCSASSRAMSPSRSIRCSTGRSGACRARPVGFAAAVEMCNNNGHCRKFDAGTMCPSYRATREEQHLTRGRANTLRLAVSGQLGPDAFTSDALYDTLDLCVSCKGCKRECPTGVDMAKMKIEFLHHYHGRHGWPLKERLIAYLPRYAPLAARVRAPCKSARPRAGPRQALGEVARALGSAQPAAVALANVLALGGGALSGVRAGSPATSCCLPTRSTTPSSPRTSSRPCECSKRQATACTSREARARGRPLCCGRTFLAAGMVNEARREARRMLDALAPYVDARHSGRRARAVVSFHFARRVPLGDAGQRDGEARRSRHCSSRSFSRAKQAPDA